MIFPQLLNLLAIICSYSANFESDSPKPCMQSHIQGARISTLGVINFRLPSGNAAVSLCEICWNQTEPAEILFNWRYNVNIHMQTVGVECKFPRDIRVDKKSESSPDSKGGGNYFMTRLSGNSASKGHSRITDCINSWMESYKWHPAKICGTCSNSLNHDLIK